LQNIVLRIEEGKTLEKTIRIMSTLAMDLPLPSSQQYSNIMNL